jgi:phage gpG-like protein
MLSPLYSADGLSVGVDVDQRGRLLSELEGLAKKYADVRPLALQIARLLRASFARNIDEGGRPRWQALSANTLAAKALKGYPAKPLVASRLLRTAVAQRNARGNVTYVTADGALKVGVNLLYARWLQEGTRPYVIVPKRKGALAFEMAGGKVVARRVRHPGLVPRPFIVIQPEDWREIRLLIKAWQADELPAGED